MQNPNAPPVTVQPYNHTKSTQQSFSYVFKGKNSVGSVSWRNRVLQGYWETSSHSRGKRLLGLVAQIASLRYCSAILPYYSVVHFVPCTYTVQYGNLSFQLLRKVTFAQFWKKKWEQKRKREQSFCPILRGPHMSFFFILLICERRKFLPRNSRFYSIIPKKFVRVKSKFDKTLCSSLRWMAQKSNLVRQMQKDR